MNGQAEIVLAAEAVSLGLDGLGLLRSSSPIEVLVAQAVVSKADELQRRRDKNLATMIGNNVGAIIAKAFKSKK